jgi:ketosteroid isomerase-like protein
MASANVELVRSICAAWGRGDYSSVEWAHPEIEFVLTGGPTPGSWTGIAAMAEAWVNFLSAWEEFSNEAEEFRELDAERVLVLVHAGGRGKTSGLDLEQLRAKGAQLFHIQGGKVTKLVLYGERERAFSDLGLPPETGSPVS